MPAAGERFRDLTAPVRPSFAATSSASRLGSRSSRRKRFAIEGVTQSVPLSYFWNDLGPDIPDHLGPAIPGELHVQHLVVPPDVERQFSRCHFDRQQRVPTWPLA